MPFRVPKFLGESNGKICSEMHLLQSRISKFSSTPRLPELSPSVLNSPPTLKIETPTSILFENTAFIPGLPGALNGPRTPCRRAPRKHCVPDGPLTNCVGYQN